MCVISVYNLFFGHMVIFLVLWIWSSYPTQYHKQSLKVVAAVCQEKVHTVEGHRRALRIAENLDAHGADESCFEQFSTPKIYPTKPHLFLRIIPTNNCSKQDSPAPWACRFSAIWNASNSARFRCTQLLGLNRSCFFRFRRFQESSRFSTTAISPAKTVASNTISTNQFSAKEKLNTQDKPWESSWQNRQTWLDGQLWQSRLATRTGWNRCWQSKRPFRILLG